MAKQGQHKNDAHDKTKSKGHNNPSKSVTITTGSYKKQATYHKQEVEHTDWQKQPQAAKNEWNEDTRDKPTTEGSPRARSGDMSRSGRAHSSGSDSNASSKTRGH
ncbi:MAG: hypothetical protein ACRDI2_24610 [Chloroflexota bacterium]